jgi:hypothetical protein
MPSASTSTDTCRTHVGDARRHRPLPQPQRAGRDGRRDRRRSSTGRDETGGETRSTPRSSTTTPEDLYERALRVPVDDARRHDRQGQRDVPDVDRLRRDELVGRGGSRSCSPPAGGSTTRPTTRRCCACSARCARSRSTSSARTARGSRSSSTRCSKPRPDGEPPHVRYRGVRRHRAARVRARAAARPRSGRGVRGARALGAHVAAHADPAGDRRSIPGLDVAAAYRPAGDGDEVGGDFYDVFQIGRGRLGGRARRRLRQGRRGGVVTALVRYTLRAAAVRIRAAVGGARGPRRRPAPARHRPLLHRRDRAAAPRRSPTPRPSCGPATRSSSTRTVSPKGAATASSTARRGSPRRCGARRRPPPR